MGLDKIVGEWKDFEFKKIEPHTVPALLKHLRQFFYREEPIQKAVGISEARANDSDKRILHHLEDNLSFIAVKKNNPNEVVGVMINVDCKKGENHPEFEPTSPLTPILRKVMNKLKGSSDLYSQFEIDRFVEIHTISVAEQFRGVGLATEMYRRGISLITDLGYPLIMSEFSNPNSRKIGEKLGFEEISRLNFIDIKDDYGEQILPNATPEELVNVAILNLKK